MSRVCCWTTGHSPNLLLCEAPRVKGSLFCTVHRVLGIRPDQPAPLTMKRWRMMDLRGR